MKYLDENGLLYVIQKIKTWLTGKTDIGHKHVISDITDYQEYELPTASETVKGGIKVGAGLEVKNGVLNATGGGTADAVDWSNVTNKPTALSSFSNDTGYQTESDVNAKIQEVVGSAPEALNTLKEISDALGNDKDFASTITTELGKKANSSDIIPITNAEIDTICS